MKPPLARIFLWLVLLATAGLPRTPHAAVAVGRVPWTQLSSLAGDLPLPNGGDQQTSCVTADVDNDGDVDFFIAERSIAPSLILYRRVSEGWEKYVIEAGQLDIEAGGDAADIDGDGDLDVAFGRDSRGSEVWWWENPYPNLDPSVPWVRRIIKTGSGNQHHDQRFGDFDGDGRIEFATWINLANLVQIYEIPEDPTSSPWTLVAQISLVGEGMDVIDVDLDGKPDILAGGHWIGHESGNTYTAHPIDASYTAVRMIGGQFVPGGRPEVVMNSGDGDGPLNFYQFDGETWQTTTLIPLVIHGHSLEVGDVDRDGHLDIFAAEMGQPGAGAAAKAWMLWGDGTGQFSIELISTGVANHMSRLADLDGDTDLDIVMKPFNFGAPRIDVFLNESPPPTLSLTNWVRHSIDTSLPNQAVFVEAADLDKDGDIDLAAGGHWWENPGLLEGTWVRHAVGTGFNNLITLQDFDGDGNVDMLGTEGIGQSPNHTFRWARNNGSGIFTVLSNIESGGSGDFVQGRVTGVFQGAQRQVLLSWHNGGGGVHALTVPADPVNQTWTFQTLTPTTEQEDLSTGDIDGDLDLDILLGTSWLENTGSGWVPHTLGSLADLGTAEPDRNDLADVDGDGDLDAVVALENGLQILWFENPRPSGSVSGLWTRRRIGISPGEGFSMDTRDMDGDGDPDVLVGEHRGSLTNRVMIFENNGSSEDWPFHVIDSQAAATADHHDGTQLVDMDGDGDLDIISLGWTNPKLWLYENKAPGLSTFPVAKPVIIPSGGTYLGNVQVRISSATAGAAIRYTLDGTEPTSSSLLYVEPFTLTATTLIRARGFSTGRVSSEITEGAFTIEPDSIAPELVSVTAHGDPNLVVIEFSEAVDAATAGNPANYTLDQDLTLNEVVLQPDLTHVLLSVSTLTTGIVYGVTVRNITDRSVPPNTITPNHLSFVFLETPVSDHFNGEALDESIWEFVNPLGDAQLTFTGEALRISIPQGRSHDVWIGGNQAPRVMQKVQDKDFEVEVKFLSAVNRHFQVQGLLVQQDLGNFLRMDVIADGSTIVLFAADFVDGAPTILLNRPIAQAQEHWLRVKRTGNLWTYSHSANGTNWSEAATFTREMIVREVGVFASIAGDNPAFTAEVDYFFNTAAPISGDDTMAVKITGQPVDITVEELTAATFTVQATGAPPLLYQWRRGGQPIPGATNSSYTILATSADNDVKFDVLISNPHGSIASRLATLTLAGPVPVNGLVLWLRADAGTVLDGNLLTEWVDQSAHARIALPDFPLNQPTLVENALNGLPVVRFDGTNDSLSFVLPISGLPGLTIFLVAANHQNQTGGASQAEAAAVYWEELTAWGTVYFSPYQSRINLGFGTTQPGNQIVYPRAESIGNSFTLTAAMKSGTTDSIYVNGESVVSQNGKLPTLAGCGDIGTLGRGFANGHYAGDIAEVLMYDKALTDNERGAVELYLDGKYQLSSPEPRVTSLNLVPTARGFMLKLTGIPGRTYQLHRATDIRFRIWNILLQTNSPTGLVQYEDRVPPKTQAFYRAWSP